MTGQSMGKREFLSIFKELCHTRNDWQVWADLITVMACSLSNSTDHSEKRLEAREKEYAECINRLGGVEKPSQVFENIVMALERDQDQDYLGSLYMGLNLGNHWKGQYFTPYTVCRAMSEMTIGDCRGQIDEKGWISICDPCVGGGAMLMAAANAMKRQSVNYHNHVLFIGQDVDRVVGMMAYIQISLLGCPGYIVVGNSLTNPIVGSPLMPSEQEGQEFWYTPFYNSKVWHWRRSFALLDGLTSTRTDNVLIHDISMERANKYYFFFYFEEQEGDYVKDI